MVLSLLLFLLRCVSLDPAPPPTAEFSPSLPVFRSDFFPRSEDKGSPARSSFATPSFLSCPVAGVSPLRCSLRTPGVDCLPFPLIRFLEKTLAFAPLWKLPPISISRSPAPTRFRRLPSGLPPLDRSSDRTLFFCRPGLAFVQASTKAAFPDFSLEDGRVLPLPLSKITTRLCRFAPPSL